MLNEELQKIKQDYQSNKDAIDFYFDVSLPSVAQGLQIDNQRLLKNARQIMINTKQITGSNNLLLIENQIIFDLLNY
jgi:hypothetical protein